MSTQNYYLHLKFDSAKYFPETKKPRKQKESSYTFIKVNDTLFWSHITNPLHVLCGLRPKNFFRETLNNYNTVPQIDDLAKSARVKIHNVVEIQQTGKNGNWTKLVTEVFTGTKSVHNSHDKGSFSNTKIILDGKVKTVESPYLTWDRIKYHVGEESFEKFTNFLFEFTGQDFRKMSAIKTFECLNQNKTDEKVLKFFADTNLPKSYSEIILNGKTEGQFFNQSGYGILRPYFVKYVNRSPEQITTISGEIIVKVPESFLEKIKKISCTILDGGVLTISKLSSEQEISEEYLSTFKPVKVERV